MRCKSLSLDRRPLGAWQQLCTEVGGDDVQDQNVVALDAANDGVAANGKALRSASHKDRLRSYHQLRHAQTPRARSACIGKN